MGFIQTTITQRPLPSTVVGNALEALIGAIYLDRGYKDPCSGFIHVNAVRGRGVDETSADFKSSLYHWAQ